MSRSKCSRNGAFTVAELLLAVLLLAVLAVFLFPGLERARIQQKKVLTVNNLRQIATATFAYATDHQGKTPPNDGSGAPVQSWGPGYAKGHSPRKLFSNARWGLYGDGQLDYLNSPDVLYSPFAELFKNRKKGMFSEDPKKIGYCFYYSLSEERLPNDRVTGPPRSVLYSEFYTQAMVEEYQFTSDECAVLYLDGTVRLFPVADIQAALKAKRTFHQFATERR